MRSISCIRYAIEKTNHRVPVIAGTGSNHTEYAVNLSKKAEELGAEALLCVTPYYNKTSQAGLIAHFSAIAKAVTLPIILYNVPSRTGVNILPETCRELAKIDNIVAIKAASGNISQITQVAALCGDDLDIYSGNDDQIVPIMALGGKGVISVLSNCMPFETHEITQLCLDGKYEEAREKVFKTLGFAKALFSDVNPIPVKEALNLMGFEVGECRLPLVRMSDDKIEKLKASMNALGLIK